MTDPDDTDPLRAARGIGLGALIGAALQVVIVAVVFLLVWKVWR